MFYKKFISAMFVIFLFSTQLIYAQLRIDEVGSPASVKLNRQRGLNMLDEIKDIIKVRYYDKNYRGINLDERFKTAAERIRKNNSAYSGMFHRQIFLEKIGIFPRLNSQQETFRLT